MIVRWTHSQRADYGLSCTMWLSILNITNTKGTLWQVKTQRKSIEHRKPYNIFVRSILQILNGWKGTRVVFVSWVIPNMLNNAAPWGIIKMQILFQLSLCILLFFHSPVQLHTAVPASSGISAVDQRKVFQKQILQWDIILITWNPVAGRLIRLCNCKRI